METFEQKIARHETLSNELETVITEYETLKGQWNRYNSDELIFTMLTQESEDYQDQANVFETGIKSLIKLFLDPEKSASIPNDVKKQVGPMLPVLLDFFTSLKQDDNMDSIEIFNFREYGHSIEPIDIERLIHKFSRRVEDLKKDKSGHKKYLEIEKNYTEQREMQLQ